MIYSTLIQIFTIFFSVECRFICELMIAHEQFSVKKVSPNKKGARDLCPEPPTAPRGCASCLRAGFGVGLSSFLTLQKMNSAVSANFFCLLGAVAQLGSLIHPLLPVCPYLIWKFPGFTGHCLFRQCTLRIKRLAIRTTMQVSKP